MIKTGVDGTSRGDKSAGVMVGIPMAVFMPLHLTAFEESPSLKDWIWEVTQDLNPQFLTPEGWFTNGHSFRNSIWAPPPAAADVVVEQLSIAKHKRPSVCHLVVVHRVFTSEWRKHLTRATDFYFRLACAPIWDLELYHEPLLIFVSLPLTSHSPRFKARNELLDKFESLLLGPRVLQAGEPAFRSDLRQLFSASRSLL
jgi:hypothetical protein